MYFLKQLRFNLNITVNVGNSHAPFLQRRRASAASPSTVPQCGTVCPSALRVTEHVSVATEDSSVWTVINATWRPLWRFSAILAPNINATTYLLT